MKKKNFLCCLLGLTLFICTSCKPSNPRISTTVYPIQYLVERIGGSYVNVELISKDGAIQTTSVKENYEETLKDSKALFYIADLEPYFDVYSENIRSSKVDLINLANKSAFYKFQRYTSMNVDGKVAVVESPYYEGSVFANVDVYKSDPMIWMDPMAMISAAEIIRDYLVEQYPEYKNAFETNFKGLELDLTRLDVEYQDLKNTGSAIAFVSLTPSFGTWQKAYGVKVYPVCLSRYGALPSFEQLQIIKQKIVDDGIKYIAHEQNLNASMESLYRDLEKELGLQRIELSNLSSLSKNEKNENKDYLTIMYENLTTLENIANNS